MQEEAKRQNAELLGVYNISYMFPDGYSSDTEQDLRIHFPMQAGWNSRKLAVLHRVSEGNYQILDGTEQGKLYGCFRRSVYIRSPAIQGGNPESRRPGYRR